MQGRAATVGSDEEGVSMRAAFGPYQPVEPHCCCAAAFSEPATGHEAQHFELRSVCDADEVTIGDHGHNVLTTTLRLVGNYSR